MSGWAAGLGSGVVSAFGQWSANRANLKESARNRAFQERMSNTAIQRRMEDMRKAGVNPILAARFDASTPAGAMANLENVGAAGVQGMASGGATALAIARQEKELANMDAATRKLTAETANIDSQRLYTIARTQLAELDAAIREPIAWASTAFIGALPAEIRGNPEKTKEYLLSEFKKFVDDNPELVGESAAMGRLVWSSIKNVVTALASAVNDQFGPDPKPNPGSITGKPTTHNFRSSEHRKLYEAWQNYKKAGGKWPWPKYADIHGLDLSTGKRGKKR